MLFFSLVWSKGIDEFLRAQNSFPYILGLIGQGGAIVEMKNYYPELQQQLYKSGLRIIVPSYSKGLSLYISQENLDILKFLSAEISFGTRIFRAKDIVDEEEGIGYFGGVSLEFKRLEYEERRFHLSEPDPLFIKYGTAKNKFSFSAGIAKRTRIYRLGVLIGEFILKDENLQEKKDKKTNMPIKLECEYSLNKWIFLNGMLEYDCNLNAYITSEAWMKEGEIGIRLGANLNGSGMGLSLRPESEKGIEIRYSIYYPYHMGGMLSHQASFIWRMKMIPPVFPDIIPDDISLVNPPVATVPNSLELTILNDGKRRASSFNSALLENGKRIFEFKIPPLNPHARTSLKIPYTPNGSGIISLTIETDTKNEIIEKNEENNRLEKTLFIHPYPRIALDALGETLTLVQKTDIFRNEPLVPIIFFGENSVEADSLYFKTICEIAKRLKENPDILLEIRGYYDIDGDKINNISDGKELAIARAMAVKNAFVKIGGDDKRLMVISDGYDFSAKRAYKQDFEGTRRGKRLIAEENRRVELNARLNAQELVYSEPGDSLNDKFLDNLSSLAPIIERNPSLIVMVSLIGGQKPTSDYDIYLRLAKIAAQKIIENLPPQIRSRVYFEHVPEESDSVRLRVSLLASPILFDPIQIEKRAVSYQAKPENSYVKFVPKFALSQKISHYKLIVEDTNGDIFWFSGGETIPDTIEWNWQNKKGDYPSVWETYRAKLIIRDEFGYTAESEPVPLFINLENIENLKENLILTQFIFGETESEVKHQNARIEYIARQILNRLRNESDFSIEISGHTDNVGVKEGNMRLSLERARTATEKLRNYLFELISFTNENELESFLQKKNIKLNYKGLGDTTPLTVVNYDENRPVNLLLGDNNNPLGRIINRRVEINFKKEQK